MSTALTRVASVLGTVAASMLSLVDLPALKLDRTRLKRLTAPLFAFGAGSLLGDALIRLIPEALSNEGPGPRCWMLAGMLVVLASGVRPSSVVSGGVGVR